MPVEICLRRTVVAKKAQKPERQRSPNYPAVGLPQAVKLVRALYEKDGRAGAPQDIAVKRMGFTSLHGQSRAVLSALRKFGLIDYQGNRVIPTPLAIDIIKFPASTERSVQARRTAALNPAIY